MQLGGIFRPGRGAVISRYTSAFVTGATYPNDWVTMSITATSLQGVGADGVVEGQTLLASDFIYTNLADTDGTGRPGSQIGVCMGSGIDAVNDITNVTAHVVAADNLIVVQSWGMHPGVRTDSSVTAGDELVMGATAGEAVSNPMGTNPGLDRFMGVAYVADSAYTRVTASDEEQCAAFIRCDF